MVKVSASRMFFIMALPLMFGSVWAQPEVAPSLEDDQNVLNEIGSSIRPLAFKPDNQISVNHYGLNVPAATIPGVNFEHAKANILSNGELNYAIEINGLKYNARTGKMEQRKKNPYSLAEYLKNGKIAYTDDFLSDTSINDCLPKYNQFQAFTDIAGEVDKCFAKKPSAIDKLDLSHEQLFGMEQNVCDCLYNANNTGVTRIMNFEKERDHGSRTDDVMKNDIQKKMMDMAAKASAFQDGMMFQSHMLYHDPNGPLKDRKKDPTLMYGTPFVSQIFKSGGDAQNYLLDRSGDAVGLAMNLRGDTQNSTKKSDAKLAEQLKKEIGKISIENKSAYVLSENNFKPGQCVSAKEYFSYKQFPDSNNFYKNLLNEKNFDPKKWNYITLEKELKAKSNTIPYTEESKREMEELRDKIRFLHRNPMLKTLMAADTNFDEYARKTKTLTPEVKSLLETTSNKVLSKKKKELFELVKKHFTPSNVSCTNVSNSACQEDVLKNVKTFDEDMKRFFNDQDVALLTRAQAEKSTFQLVDDFIENPIPQEKVPVKQNELENFVFNEVISVDEKTKEENFVNPADCRSVNSPYASRSSDPRCVMTYAVYCPVVKKAQTRLAKMLLRNELLPNGEEKIKSITYKNYFEPDIDKNPDFKSFNDAFCSIPRKGNNGKQNISFNSFQDSFCKANASDKRCSSRSYENIMALREVFDGDHGEAVLVAGATSADVAMVNNAIKLNQIRPTSNRSKDDANAIANSNSGTIRDVRGLEKFFGEIEGFGNDAAISSITKKKEDSFESAGMLSNLSNVVESGNLNKPQSQGHNSYDEDFSGYSNLIMPQEISEAEKSRVDKLPQSTREELLSQWREELNDYKRSNEGKNPDDIDSDAGLKAKIAALETLLEQQRKLTDDQYKILNSAISNKQVAQAAVSSQESQTSPKSSEEDFQEKVKARSASGFTTMGSHGGSLAEETFRAPANLKDSQFNASGSNGGASASVQRSSSSSGAVSGAASDSLAREEAKLVNLRRHSDGSITIDSNSKNGQFVPNAITVPVSDEQYRLLQSNPTALNLSQIEKSIPKEQLDKLEKTGEIILVLQNGANPPFEVKLEKKDNQLVYQVRDNNGQKLNPVRRIYTRQALELELKVQ